MLDNLTSYGQAATILGAWSFACCAIAHKNIKQGWVLFSIVVAIVSTLIVAM